MHYHVKVGLPAGMFDKTLDWDTLREQIRAEVDVVMDKYNDSGDLSKSAIEEFGIKGRYHDDGVEKFL